MTDAPQTLSIRDIPQDLLRNRLLQVLVAVTVLIQIYNLAIVASYSATQKARESKAIAENSALRQQAEAEAQELQADLVDQEAQIRSQLNTYVERRKYAEAEKAEIQSQITQWANREYGGGTSVSQVSKHMKDFFSNTKPQRTPEFVQACNDKFETIWSDYQELTNDPAPHSWQFETVSVKTKLYTARCDGFTTAQSQQLYKAQRAILANLERNFCSSSSAYQREHGQELAKFLGRSASCRK